MKTARYTVQGRDNIFSFFTICKKLPGRQKKAEKENTL